MFHFENTFLKIYLEKFLFEFETFLNEPFKGPLVFNSKDKEIKILIFKNDHEQLIESCYQWDSQLFENDSDI